MTNRTLSTTMLCGVGIVGTVFAIAMANLRRNSFAWAAQQKALNREGAEKEATEAYSAAKTAADVIFKAEREKYDTVTDSIRARYNESLAETGRILSAEESAVNTQIAEAQKNLDIVTDSISVLEATENSTIDDVLKNDTAYRALRTAKKALKKAKKDTTDVTAKMKTRRDEIAKQIANSRTEAEKQLFKDRDKCNRIINHKNDLRDAIVSARSDEEKAAFSRFKAISKELDSRKWTKDTYANERTEEERAAISAYEDLRKRVLDISSAERAEIDPLEAMGQYLKAQNVPRALVAVIGWTPAVLGTCGFVWLLTSYIRRLHKVLGGMR